jgi:hypothetical protein
LVICLFQLVTVPFLSSQSNQTKQIRGWVITPPHTTYPVNHTTTATLASTSNPSISLVLQARFQAAGNRPQDEGKGMVILSICMTSNGDHFQANVQRALDGVPVNMSFDGGKPIASAWQGGDAMMELWPRTPPGLLPPPGSPLRASAQFGSLEFMNKLLNGKTLTISYPIRDSGARKSATFDLSGVEAVMASICPVDGCKIQQ